MPMRDEGGGREEVCVRKKVGEGEQTVSHVAMLLCQGCLCQAAYETKLLIIINGVIT